MLQIKLSSYHKDCYDISHPGQWAAGGSIWVDGEGIILEKTAMSFNIEELEQIIAFMKRGKFNL